MEENKNDLNEQENSTVKVIEKEEINIKTLENAKEEKQTTSNDNKKSKLKIVLITLVMILVLIAILSTIFAAINLGNSNIIKGIKIAQIDVSKMSEEEAKKTLEEIYLQKDENEIYFTYEEFETSATYKTLEVEYQIEKAIKQAHEIGRSGNLLKDNFDILKAWIKGTNIDLEVAVDVDMMNQVIQNINNSIEGRLIQPSYYREEDKLIITSGKEGLKVEEKQIIEEIYRVVKEENREQNIIIPLITATPDEISIEKIHKEVYKKVQDAYYTKEPFTIYPESEGIDFDIENAKLLITEEKEQYEIPLTITKPNKTTKEIGTEAFPDLLATFSTKYQASNTSRTTNLKLAANKINGTVLLPGEEFSYNKTVGERTVAAGFKMAATFSAGKVVDGLGGGICQISSTLYDAVIMANLDVTVRRNHQFVTSYVPAGKDATVVWGSQDFKFKNTRKHPIRITATVQGGVATVQIWGIKEEVEYDITIETKKVSTIAYTTEYVQDPSLPAGQQKVVQSGSNGRKVEAYKVTKLNGKVVSTTLLSKDTYNAMKQIIHVGTGQ
ncbi:MAG: VanW family protein [Clostridia bacterium]|nr:VanW family protein [Clostridia bacterium]